MNETGYNGDVNSLSESDAIEHVNEKYLEMVMNAQQAGRQIPARPVSEEVVGHDIALSSVEASQRLMQRSRSLSFSFGKTFGKHYERIFKHA